jgi:hypothetical protein
VSEPVEARFDKALLDATKPSGEETRGGAAALFAAA